MSALEMLGMRLRRYNAPERACLESLDLVRILSLTPLDRWIKKPSWQVEAGLRQAPELERSPWASPYFGLTLGSGAAARLFSDRLAFYGLAQLDGGAGAAFRSHHRAGPGATGGLILEPARRLRVGAEASYWRYVLGDERSRSRLRLEAGLGPAGDWSARLRLQRHGPADEIRLELHRYF